MNGFFIDSHGKYMAECPVTYGLAQGWIRVDRAPIDADQVWDFDAGDWGPIPLLVPAQIMALDGLLTLGAAGYGPAYHAWATDPARSFDEKAFIDKAMIWKRQDPIVIAAAVALGITPEQVDALFIAADANA